MLNQIQNNLLDVNKAYDHVVQIATVAGLSYISSAVVSFFTGVTPITGMAFILSACLVQKVCAPYITVCCEPHSKGQNQSFPYLVAKWTVALLTARTIFAICGVALGFGQIVLLCSAFCAANSIRVIALGILADTTSDKRPKAIPPLAS